MTESESSTTVVIVNFRSSELIAAGYGRYKSPSCYEVVVVDNWSDVEEAASIERLCILHEWSLVCSKQNVGFGSAVNLGVQRAKELGASRYLLLNPDAWLAEDDINSLNRVMDEGEFDAVAPIIEREDGTVWFAGGQITTISGQARHHEGSVDWLTGACVLISDRAWQLTNGFETSYFLYWEDVDFSRRLVSAGGRLGVTTEAKATHLVGATQGNASHKSELYFYYSTRNRAVFARSHLRPWKRLLWATTTPAYCLLIARGGGIRKARGIRLTLLRAMLFGLLAGRKGTIGPK